MALLNRESFKNRSSASPAVLGEADVPVLGGKVGVRKLSAAGRDRVQHALYRADNYRARLVIETACDESGKRLFTEADLKWLAELDYDILEPIVEKANELNEYADHGGLEKNSSTPQSGDSPTD